MTTLLLAHDAVQILSSPTSRPTWNPAGREYRMMRHQPAASKRDAQVLRDLDSALTSTERALVVLCGDFVETELGAEAVRVAKGRGARVCYIPPTSMTRHAPEIPSLISVLDEVDLLLQDLASVRRLTGREGVGDALRDLRERGLRASHLVVSDNGLFYRDAATGSHYYQPCLAGRQIPDEDAAARVAGVLAGYQDEELQQGRVPDVRLGLRHAAAALAMPAALRRGGLDELDDYCHRAAPRPFKPDDYLSRRPHHSLFQAGWTVAAFLLIGLSAIRMLTMLG